MKYIPLLGAPCAIVDDEDFERVAHFKWFAARRGRRIYASKNGEPPHLLHQLILSAPPGFEVHHIDGEGLHCWRANLGLKTRMDNLHAFQRKRLGASSQYRGVCWDSERSKWAVFLNVGGKPKFFGGLTDELGAARAANVAINQFRNPGSQLNIV